MPRENSFSDSEGRSLTPDLESEDEMIGQSPPASNSRRQTKKSSHHPLDDSERNGQSRSLETSMTPTMIMSASGFNGVLFDEPQETARATKRAKTMSSLMSRRSRAQTNASTTSQQRAGTLVGAERFRSVVRKVMHLHRSSTALWKGFGVGAEPGIDPSKPESSRLYGHIHAQCLIEVMDYSSIQSKFQKFDNRGFLEYLDDPGANKRADWAKVRWINVVGISWDVMSALALEYEIHPLALEDIIHGRIRSRSKADYYIKHLFIRILRHTIAKQNADDVRPGVDALAIPNIPRTQSPSPLGEEGKVDEETSLGGSKLSTRLGREDIEEGNGESEKPFRSRTSSTLRMRRSQLANAITVDDLKRGDRVEVATHPFFICLFKDGTIISFSSGSETDFVGPISARLRRRDTGLRATADPSMLVQSLLDLIVDNALEVVDEYQQKILKFEQKVLVRPSMKTVRNLHILSGDLTMHKRTLEPIKTLVYGLRRYDLDRTAALVDGPGGAEVKGYMSHKSKIYLADVHDHIDHVLNSMDMFASISENLINYTFNMASYEMNGTMKRLTYVTVIFLPLTLLAGYFGMNFGAFWSVHNRSDLFFWEIAIPVVIVVVLLVMCSDLGRVTHLVGGRWNARKVEKNVKRRQL